MVNYDGFIKFLKNENMGVKKDSLTNGENKEENKEARRTSLTGSKPPIAAAQLFAEDNRGVSDAKAVFDELYDKKTVNLSRETQLIDLNSEKNRLRSVINIININNKKGTVDELEIKEELRIEKENEAKRENELENERTGVAERRETLETFKDLKFSENDKLVAKIEELTHYRNQETKKQRGELSELTVEESKSELDELRKNARQLKRHAAFGIETSKKELKVVEVKIEKIQKAQENTIRLPEQQVTELAELKAAKTALIEIIQQHEQTISAVTKVLEVAPLSTTITQDKDKEEKSKQPTEIKEPQPTPETDIKEKQTKKEEPSIPGSVTPEDSKKIPEAKENDPHVFADVTMQERPEKENPELPKKEETQPSSPDKEAKPEPSKDVLDSITTDPTPDLKKAVIENLEAKKELSEVTIEKKEELLKAVEKNKALQPKIAGLKKEIEDEKKLLEEINKDLKAPDKLVANIKERIEKEPDFPKDTAETIKATDKDTADIKTKTNKLKEMKLPELKEAFLPNSSKFKWLRRVLNLWPLATLPAFIAWAAMIMPAAVFTFYGLPLAGAAFGIFCAGYFLPKIINKGLDKYKEYRERKAGELGQEPELAKEQTKEKNQEQAKGKTEMTKGQKLEGKPEIAKAKETNQTRAKSVSPRSKNSSLAKDSRDSHGQAEQIQPSAEQRPLENPIEGETSKRAKVLNFLKKNWRPIAIIVGVSLLAGVAAVFLMPAVAPILAGSVAIGGAFTIGTMALIGAGVSIGALLIDHFGLKRVQNNLANKEHEKTNELEKNCRDKIRSYEQDKSKTVEENLVQKIKEAAEHTKNQPEINQPTQTRTSVTREAETIQMTPVKTDQSRQSSVISNVIPLESKQAAQPQQSISATQLQQSGTAQQQFSAVTKKGQTVAELTNRRNSQESIDRSPSIRGKHSTGDRAQVQ